MAPKEPDLKKVLSDFNVRAKKLSVKPEDDDEYNEFILHKLSVSEDNMFINNETANEFYIRIGLSERFRQSLIRAGPPRTWGNPTLQYSKMRIKANLFINQV